MALVSLHNDAKIGVLGIGDFAVYAGDPTVNPFGTPVEIPDDVFVKYAASPTLAHLMAQGHLVVGTPASAPAGG